jgi:uncharacterized 2Fe-2S/4Fe-4S cluster protein (DUF4445 family)
MKSDKQTTRVIFQPSGRVFDVRLNETLFEVAIQESVDIDTVCGGNGTCGKCKVRFDSEPPPASPIDHVQLSGGEIQQGYRLACQTTIQRDAVVYAPSTNNQTNVKIVHQGVQRDVALKPNVRKVFIPYTAPRTRDEIADWDAVMASLPDKLRPVRIPLHWLRQLPAYIRAEQGLTVVVAGHEVIGLEEGETTAYHYGVAIDIGSTTVVGFLIDLNTGEEVAVVTDVNRQVKFGDDVIMRLSRTQRNPAELANMHQLIISQLNEILRQLSGQVGIEITQINEVTIVGNMTMHHFLLKLDSTYLGLSPYAPVIREAFTTSAAELGLILEKDTPIYVLPNIAGFVGSDTVGVILAGEMHTSDKMLMAVDVGTNGEVALGSKDRLIACSAPAGPAFEGGRIKFGMRAAPGAIDHASIEDDIRFTTIGNTPPCGICGSGLVDIIAELLRIGIIDSSGKFNLGEELPSTLPDKLRNRIVETDDRKKNYFILVRAREAGTQSDILLTQEDIREFQLAKGAIRSGEIVLQQVMDLRDEDIDEVLLAGGFGTYIDTQNARRVGLVPQIPVERLRSVGNAAGVGARLALISTKERLAGERIGRQTEHIRLSGMAKFNKALIRAMRFPKNE